MAMSSTAPHRQNHHNFLFLFILIFLPGCFSGETTSVEPVVLESRQGGEDSLHTTAVCTSSTCAGEDCSASGCHVSNTGNIVFSISGSVFQFQDLTAYIDTFAAIEFYTGPGGSGELHKTLNVDAFGNFYSTEPITTMVYPALSYEDDNQVIRHAYMPRPLVPTIPSTCNFCHQLAAPPTELPTINDPQYIRINNGVFSSPDPDINYHQSFAIDPGPDCLNSTCHGAGSANTVFTMAGVVIDTSTGEPYALGDAALGLFPEECDDQRYGCQSAAAPEEVVTRSKVAKTYVEVNRRGHFYSTQPIDWTSSTYPTLSNYTDNVFCRNIKHMVSAVTSSDLGNCYACHGTTQPPISISGDFSEAEKCNLDEPPPNVN